MKTFCFECKHDCHCGRKCDYCSLQMELIILNDGMYQLIPLTKQMMEHMSLLVKEIDCFDLCDIIRLHLTTYHEAPFNAHVMKDGSGDFIGCICN